MASPPPSPPPPSSSFSSSSLPSPPPPLRSSSPPPPPPPSSSPPPPLGASSPPPPSDSNSSPPPPKDSKSSPPPPKSSQSPPSPSDDGNSSSPPPPPPPPPPPLPPPPPPPRRSLAPPSHHRPSSNSPSDSSSSSSSSSPNVPLIVGLAVGGGLLLLVLIAIFWSCTRKKRRPHDQMNYYRDHSNGSKFSDYYSGPQHQQANWQNSQPMEHMVKVPPPPGATNAGYGGWSHPPPPPLSSGQPSSEFSGPHGPPLPPPPPSFALGFTQSTFTYDELEAATGGFSQANLLGQGGYGYVHKGVLPNGKDIAVKSLKSGSGQGDREFQAEVEIISRVHHRHLVSLVGYCIAESQRILIYEFVPNNTLEYHLHGKDRPIMDWPIRLRIALGAARGLAYLHEDCHPKIIHRDIKAANILLDFNFEAKVSDFGLAKLSTDNHTHVSTRVMGTFGYLAPEYAASGKLTDKSDVFSFGVMLLELITGKRPVETDMDDSLVDWATPIIATALAEGDYGELADPRLKDNYVPQEMERMVACAGACIRRSSKRRPRMIQIVRALEGDASLYEVHEWTKQNSSSAFGGGSMGSGSYISGMKTFRESGPNGEVDFSGDYGQSPSDSSTGNDSREMSKTGNL